MKHSLKVIFILLLLFLLAQFIGLYIIDHYSKEKLPFDIERPKFEPETSFIQIFAIILITTFFIFLLATFRAERLWKIWFFLSVGFCLIVSFSVFMKQSLALLISFFAAFLKVFRPRIILHNLTELFIYGGLAAIFVPIFNIFSVSVLLILISIYDMIAVWKTKHMIQLVKFQVKLKLFTGLLVPYSKKKSAMLGGGDIGFPLLFAGVVMSTVGKPALIIPLIAALTLALLFFKGKKNKFYPAMPFLSAGCFVGYLLTFLF